MIRYLATVGAIACVWLLFVVGVRWGVTWALYCRDYKNAQKR